MKRKLMAFCAILAAAIVAVGVGTASADADPALKGKYVEYAKVTKTKPSSKATCTPIWKPDQGPTAKAGTVCFQAYGDIFWLRDSSADGLSIRMIGQTTDNDKFGCKASAGSKAKWQYCKFSTKMSENERIAFFGAAMKGNSMKYTSGDAIYVKT